MRSTGLEMAKNQGLDSVHQNKKNKNKKFREKAAEGHVGVYGDAPMPKRCPFFGVLVRYQYVPICGVYREAPNEAPAGLLRGLLRGLLLHHYGGGAAAMGAAAAGLLLLWEQAKRNGAGGLRPANGERVRTFPNHP